MSFDAFGEGSGPGLRGDRKCNPSNAVQQRLSYLKHDSKHRFISSRANAVRLNLHGLDKLHRERLQSDASST